MMSTMDEIRTLDTKDYATGRGHERDTLVIDCDECSQQGTETCDDCMVTFLCGRQPGDAVVVELDEFRALRVIGESGLVPPLRHTVEGGART